jgi:hypothetical protein
MSVSVVEHKLALLIASAVWIVDELVKSAAPSPLFRRLLEVRRDLAFGRIDPTTALRQADIAILGLSAHEILQEPIAKYSGAAERLAKQSLAMIAECELAREILTRAQGRELTDAEGIELVAVLRSAEARVPNVEAELATASSAIDQYSAKFTQLRAAAGASASEDLAGIGLQLTKELRRLSKKTGADLEKTHESIKAVQGVLNRKKLAP